MSEGRDKKRWDYARLHKDGTRIEKTDESNDQQNSTNTDQVNPLLTEFFASLTHSQASTSTSIPPSDPSDLINTDHSEEVMTETDAAKMAELAALTAEVSTIDEDIDDYLDENLINEIGSNVNDHDIVCQRVEDLRSLYRGKHKQLKASMDDEDYKRDHEIHYTKKMDILKEYIKQLKAQRRDLRSGEDLKASDDFKAKEVKFKFLGSQVNESITRLNGIFNIEESDWSSESDDAVSKRKANISKHLEELQSLPKMIKEMMDSSSGVLGAAKSVEDCQKLYSKVVVVKDKYAERLQKEVKSREIEERKAFDKSKLNIQLPKFGGYKSSVDVYTFKSNFEKIHRTTPKSFLPDVLKNNYLENPALLLVKDCSEIEDIWKRLKDAYGDCRIMLQKKMEKIDSITGLWNHKDPEKTVEGLSKIINLMRDLMNLAKQHSIGNKLYLGDALDRITTLLGEGRLHRWLTLACDKDLVEGESQWDEFIKFLEKEAKICQQKVLLSSKKPKSGTPDSTKKNGDKTKDRALHATDGPPPPPPPPPKCHLCGKDDHVATNGPKGSKIVQYFACPKFAEKTCEQRLAELQGKGLCYQCLYPGAKVNTGKHQEGKCQREFVCKHDTHDADAVKKHVLVCADHKLLLENQQTLKEYIQRCISKRLELKDFSKNIAIHHHSYVCNPIDDHQDDEPDDGDAVYMLQTIDVDGQSYNILYDTGCRRFALSHNAMLRLGSRAREVIPGPITLGGVAGMTTKSPYGVYRVKLPRQNGEDASLTGACMGVITETFPSYPLQQIQKDIYSGYALTGGNPDNLPGLPATVGGDTHLMIGMKYQRFIPEKVFQLPSGLAIYKSVFKNSDGSYGVCGGPHPVINAIDQQHYGNGNNFMSQQFHIFRYGYQVDIDVRMLGFKDDECDQICSMEDRYYLDEDLQSTQVVPPVDHVHTVQSQLRKFNSVEEAGSKIDYRCVTHRKCQDCIDNATKENLSIREEVEDDIVRRSVTVDVERQLCTAKLPLIADPALKLAPNAVLARKVYNGVVKRLSKNPEDRASAIKAEKKLQDRGFVAFVKDLPREIQDYLRNSPWQNFLPWRLAYKSSSLSTPVRPVFDGSMPTASGESLNSICVTGRNTLNPMVEIFIRWRSYDVAYHNDVNTMYNCIELESQYWALQRYWWNDTLDPDVPPVEKVIKTLIYGCKASGNQAEHAIRLTASHFKDEFPEVNEVVQKDLYVDDCHGGETSLDPEESSHDLVDKRTQELEYVLSKGQFSLKKFTVSGRPPDPSVTKDGESVSVSGLKWFPEKDLIALAFEEPNFAKKRRGKVEGHVREVPKDLTRRICSSKVGEIYDLTGLITPITATLKLDLHDLVVRKLDWDDILPDNLRSVWVSHFELMGEIKNLRFNRAIVPHDAANLDINTLDFGDASKELVCVAIYARFLRKCGTYSCQLIFARSRLVPDGMTQPRAELYAALLNSHTGEVVRKALYKSIKGSIKFTDSQIVLFWITNDTRVLKPWARNRVIEIHRFTQVFSWLYVKSCDMIADIGTRRCTDLKAVDRDSVHYNGFPWMLLDPSQFPTMTVDEIKLSNKELQEATREVQIDPHVHDRLFYTEDEATTARDLLRARYVFSDYVIDPNHRRFATVVRILGRVIEFIRKLKHAVSVRKGSATNVPLQTEEIELVANQDLKNAEMYFFRKATEEIKKFLKPSQYEKISKEVQGVLYYTGRILPTDEVTIVGRVTDAMRDLSATTFCVPLTDRFSPIAYSVINDIHWYDDSVSHTGVETTWRYVLKHMYVIEGRSLVKKFRESCQRCRYLYKRALSVAMGPISNDNIIIAPAFYVCQADLAGPFSAYSYHNKRTTIKVWMVVFCCSTTSATNIKVMESYNTSSFLQAFMRFCCEVGYPKRVLTDEGSQLVKGCESARLDIQDLKFRIHKDTAVELNVCPVGGHNMHGKVERKIRQVRESLEKSMSNERLGVLQWETLAATVANSINNLPLTLGNKKADLDSMDLITPNRLLLGRNNERCPVGSMSTEPDFDKLIAENEKIFLSWFENWLLSHVPKLMEQPKWFKSDQDLQVGDVVLFLKEESKAISSKYQYGIVDSVETGRDGKVRKVKVRYRNHNENVDRITNRSARSLIVIHPADEINVMQELGHIAMEVDRERRASHPSGDQ